MKPDTLEAQATADLVALAAVAHGKMPSAPQLKLPEDASRTARIAELKTQYTAGTLAINENALAAKLVDRMLADLPPSDKS